MNKNDGFTTIELILAILIAGMIMAAVGTFLNFSIRSFNTTKTIIDVQYEAQMTMNQLTNIAKESTGVISIMGSQSGGSISDIYSTVGKWDLASITFNQENKDGTVDEFVITYDSGIDGDLTNDEKILVSINDAQPYILGEHVSKFVIEPALDESFETTNRVIFYIEITEKKASHEIQTQVKFRNKE